MLAERGLAPLLIGVTGKRDLRGKDAAVRRALGAAFDLLDEQLPASRKLLLTSFAAGTDTIAAEEALHRKNWRVVAVLPLEPALYAQDFDDKGTGLEGILSDPLVTTRVLAPLRTPDGHPVASAALARTPRQENRERTVHYEQAGLFIGERCALLIAVKPEGEEPGRIGGTARIVACRLAGTDAIAREIIARSSELKPPVALDAPSVGPVWLIDLDTVDRALHAPLSAVSLRQPEPRGNDMSAGGGVPSHRRTSLIAGLDIANAVERFNQQVGALHAVGESTTRPGGAANPAARLDRVRRGLSLVQQGSMRKLRAAVWVMAALFVLAAALLEWHIEFEAGRLVSLALYLVVLEAVFGLFAFARMRGWQRVAEDYRAAAEALRVQIAWWDAGLAGPFHRVDRLFLAGSLGSFALLRSAIAHLIDGASIDGQQHSAPHMVVEWIKNQAEFFERRTSDRQARLRALDFASEASLFAAFGVWLGQLASNTRDVLLLPVVVAAISILYGVVRRFRRWLRNSRTGAAGSLLTATVVIVIGSVSTAILLHGPMSDRHRYVAIAAVGLVAFAGAARFVAERLAFDAEAARYPEALAIFRRAWDACAERGRRAKASVPLPPAEPDVCALGRKAVGETEFWLRAHRIRRLVPQP